MRSCKNINYKLRGLRMAMGLTQAEMARLLYLSEQSYRRRERGEVYFSSFDIKRILEVMEVKYEDIF
jgi:DNA-binding XRE family transcriptional regulator